MSNSLGQFKVVSVVTELPSDLDESDYSCRELIARQKSRKSLVNNGG